MARGRWRSLNAVSLVCGSLVAAAGCATTGGSGSACTMDTECLNGLRCVDGVCVTAVDAGGGGGGGRGRRRLGRG